MRDCDAAFDSEARRGFRQPEFAKRFLETNRTRRIPARPVREIELSETRLVHQKGLTSPLDCIGDLPVVVRRDSGCAAGKNLPSLGDEALEEFRILPIDCVERDINTTPRHHAVRFAEVCPALRCFRLTHDYLISR